MHINPVKVSLNGFAILFKILSAHCESLARPTVCEFLLYLLTLMLDAYSSADAKLTHLLWLGRVGDYSLTLCEELQEPLD